MRACTEAAAHTAAVSLLSKTLQRYLQLLGQQVAPVEHPHEELGHPSCSNLAGAFL